LSEENWQQARLIPTSGISGQEEAERRSTSALLAVMAAVKEFGAAITKPLGAPASWLQTYIEVPFELADKRVIPDGLVRATRGGKLWTALIEVKTGTNEPSQLQVENYLDVARAEGFDAVLTISNHIAYSAAVHPTIVDRRKTKSIALHHLSWAEILTEAVQQRVYRGVADPDQAWILGELIRYLEHPKSGTLDFEDMGDAWVSVRDAVANGTLRANDVGVLDVVRRWEQLMRFAALRMSRELGTNVSIVLSRAETADPSIRVGAATKQLSETGRLTGALRIPDSISDLSVVADVRAGRVSVAVDVDAPKEGRQATRVNWLLRQLTEAPGQLSIDSWAQNSRQSMSELLRDVRTAPDKLIQDPKRDLRQFRLTASAPLGAKRGRGRGGFIDSVLDAILGFYAEVVQGLRPWTPKAPQLPSGRTAAEEAGIDIRPPEGDFTAQERRTEEFTRQGVFAPPSGSPPDGPTWVDDRSDTSSPVVVGHSDDGPR
jgi:hypothetical protein